MSMELAIFILLSVCAAFGFIYGIIRFFKSNSPLYARMIVFGIGCAMQGRIFETLMLVTRGEIQSGFHVGMLGAIGCFLFFLGVNYGQMDSLVDDGSRRFLKYRLIALAAPVIVLVLFVVYYVRNSSGFNAMILVNLVQMLVICSASYYHVKHLIIPDVEDGLIRSIRGYNLLALLYAILSILEMAFRAQTKSMVPLYIIYACIGVIMIAIVPVLEKGVKRWTI